MSTKPSLRTEHQQATRKRLIQATVDIIATKSYQSATIDHITAHANTSRATFYLHFTSKAHALLAGWEELQLPQTIKLLQELDDKSPPPKGFVRRWVSKLVSFWEDNRSVALASNQAIAVEPEIASEWFRRIWQLGSYLPRWRQRNHSQAQAADLRLFLLTTQTEHILHMWISGAAPIDRAQVIGALASQWRREFPETNE